MRRSGLASFTALIAATCFGQAAYTYDGNGRLIKANYGAVGSVVYSYDPAGNLVGRAVQASSSTIMSVNTASGGSAIAQNTFIVIKGSSLVPMSTPAAGVIWSTAPSFASGQMPTQLGGVSVTVNGKPAYIYFYCSAATSQVCTSDQINCAYPTGQRHWPRPHRRNKHHFGGHNRKFSLHG